MVDIDHLRLNGAPPCARARKYCEKYGSLEEAYAATDEPAWLTWYIASQGYRCEPIAIYCARKVLPLWESVHPGDDRPRSTIDLAERFALSSEGNPVSEGLDTAERIRFNFLVLSGQASKAAREASSYSSRAAGSCPDLDGDFSRWIALMAASWAAQAAADAVEAVRADGLTLAAESTANAAWAAEKAMIFAAGENTDWGEAAPKGADLIREVFPKPPKKRRAGWRGLGAEWACIVRTPQALNKKRPP